MDDIFIKTAEKIGSLPTKFSQNHPIRHRCLAIVNISLILGITIYPVVCYVKELIDSDFNGRRTADVILDIVTNSLYGMIILVGLLYKTVLYINDYRDMKKAFKEFDIILKHKLQANRKWLLFKYVTFHIAFVGNAIFTYKVFISIDYTLMYGIMSTWMDYAVSMEVIVAWRILVDMRMRMEVANNLIRKLYEAPVLSRVSITMQKRQSPMKDDKDVLELIEAHARLVHIIHLFNKLYGTCIILLNLNFFAEFISVVLHIVSVSVHMDELFLDLIGAVFNLGMWLVFVVNAQYVIDEGKVMVTNCIEATTSALNFYDTVSERWRTNLAHLTQCAITHLPVFTAANFYAVNFAAIFTIFNMMTGYIVVVVQFSNDSAKKKL